MYDAGYSARWRGPVHRRAGRTGWLLVPTPVPAPPGFGQFGGDGSPGTAPRKGDAPKRAAAPNPGRFRGRQSLRFQNSESPWASESRIGFLLSSVGIDSF